MQRIVPVVMCGGSGTRLWPLSRAASPKQFLPLLGEHSLFQQTCMRITSLAKHPMFQDALWQMERPIVVSNEEQRFLVLDQLEQIGEGSASLILEPQGRNTAPALTLAALLANQMDASAGADSILIVMPSDHLIEDSESWVASMLSCITVAQQKKIAMMGIKPASPETGYGYIEVMPDANPGVRAVSRFVEKPNLETAKAYFHSGRYFWNSGIFVMQTNVWLNALKKFRSDILLACQQAWLAHEYETVSPILGQHKFYRPNAKLFSAVPNESIDYAVMEHCPGSDIALEMVSLDAGWSDLGAWDAVRQALAQDHHGNAIVGDAVLMDSKHTLVHANHRMVAALGVSDLVIVETADAVLVSHRKEAQTMKALVAHLERAGRTEPNLHRKVVRPWGWYDSIDAGNGFQVKRILVKPGASLSLQMHEHRAEHWIVVRGQAQVTNGEKTFLLEPNQSTYIPKGQKHRLANPGTKPLEIIEVQSGSYLGEDDIVRFEDVYQRN